MLVPILLVSAAAVGAWYLLKDDSKPAASGETPKVPDMIPGDINIYSDGFVPSAINTPLFYIVEWRIHPLTYGETGTQYYSDFATAKQSYDVLFEFFRVNHSYWTSQGRQIDIVIVEVKNQIEKSIASARWS